MSGSSTDDPTPSLSGTLSSALASGQSLRIFDGTTDIGAATVTTTGTGNAATSTWSFTPSSALTAGTHSFTARVRSASGLEAPPSAAFSLTLANVDTTPPKLLSASALGADVTLAFDEALDVSRFPDLSSFRITINPAGSQLGERVGTISSMRYDPLDNKNLILTLTRELNSLDEVRISYRDPSTGNDSRAVQDVTGNDAASWTAQPVAVSDAANPVSAFVRWGRFSEPSTTTPGASTVEVVFNHKLQLNSSPTGPAPFTVFKLGANGTATELAVASAGIVPASAVSQGSVSSPGSGSGSGSGSEFGSSVVLINLASERLGPADAVWVRVNANAGLVDLQRQAKGLDASVAPLNLVLGGSGANPIDLGQYPSISGAGVLGDRGDDTLTGRLSGDILSGGEGRDTLTSPQGANSLAIADGVNSARAASFERDTVRIDWETSTRPALDLVFGFDVIGSSATNDAQSTNDVLALPSARIAANTATAANPGGIVVAATPVINQPWSRVLADGTTAQVTATIRSHSISNGIVRVFEDAQGTVSSIWDLSSLNKYLHGVINPGETVAAIGTRSTFVFQHSGSSNPDEHLLVELRGALSVFRLSNTPGFGDLQIIDDFAPELFDADAQLGDSFLTLGATERLSRLDFSSTEVLLGRPGASQSLIALNAAGFSIPANDASSILLQLGQNRQQGDFLLLRQKAGTQGATAGLFFD
ncbi:MAG: hypothetical protein KGN78_14685, partial [Actinomycetales bacterium]|nr:hypothetical protein [Actinomycetales bacterium]